MYECVYSLLTWCQFSNQSMLPTTFLMLSLMLTYFLLNGQHSEAIYCCCCYACITLHLSMTSIKAAKLWCYILWSLDGIWCSRIYSISFSNMRRISSSWSAYNLYLLHCSFLPLARQVLWLRCTCVWKCLVVNRLYFVIIAVHHSLMIFFFFIICTIFIMDNSSLMMTLSCVDYEMHFVLFKYVFVQVYCRSVLWIIEF